MVQTALDKLKRTDQMKLKRLMFSNKWSSVLAVTFMVVAGWSHSEAMPVAPSEGKPEVVLLGDSLTYQGGWDKLLPDCKVLNLGVNGDTVDQMSRRLPDFAKIQPKAFFIMAGTNDIAQSRDIAESLARYRAILAEVKPRVGRLYVQEVPKASRLLRNSERFNEKVEEFNAGLARLARIVGVQFIKLRIDEPNLDTYRTPDGVHVTVAGYEAWANRIRPLANCAAPP